MALPTSDIKPRSGMKGKAVHIIHVHEDFLWAMGDKSGPSELESISDDEYEEEEDEEEDGEQEHEQSKITSVITEKMDKVSIANSTTPVTANPKQLTTNGNSFG